MILEHRKSKNNNIFLGDYNGFQRFDNPLFPKAVKLEETMRGSFWNPNEVSMNNDATLFFELPKDIQNMGQCNYLILY